MPDFNSPKNPLPDLMPLEEDRSTEVSSQELSAIRASLMETSWRTEQIVDVLERKNICLLYTSPSPRDRTRSRMPSSA